MVLFAIFIVVNLSGQEERDENLEDRIHILCNVKEGDLQVRWAPGSWQLFKMAMQSGFTLTKKSILGTDTITARHEFVIPSRNSFSSHSVEIEDFEAAYELLFGEVNNDAGILGEFSAFEVGTSRYSLLLYLADLNFSLAEYLKLGWTDENYNPAQLSIYEIAINGSDQSASILGGFACIPEPLPVENIYSYPEDHSISIAWDLQHDPSRYVGFDIERRDENNHWQKLNSRPVAIVDQGESKEPSKIIYKDSVANNDRSYFYRIRGINSFGEYGPYSQPIEAQARPRLMIGQPLITSSANVGDTAIHLRLKLEGADIDQIKFLTILRSVHPDSLFQVIDTIDYLQTEYFDFSAGRHNYYLLQAYDHDHRIYTGPPAYGLLPDKEPPLAPQKVEARIDSLGSVSINWRPNQEEDLYGYRVFYKRYLEDEIIQLTTAAIPDTVFQHSLPLDLLHDRGYYMVRAEDQVGNRSADSEFSEVIVPDTIRPARPTIISTRSDTYGCILEIGLSGSPDVEEHFIQRRNLNDSMWQNLAIVVDPATPFQQELIDSSLEVGQEVEYRIRVNDRSGNYSLSNIALGRRVDNKIRPAPRNPVVFWDRRKKQMVFGWSYPERPDLQAVRIFKSSTGDIRFYTNQYIYPDALQMSETKSNWKDFEYRIPLPEKESGFIYKIRLDFTDGATSAVADFRIN